MNRARRNIFLFALITLSFQSYSQPFRHSIGPAYLLAQSYLESVDSLGSGIVYGTNRSGRGAFGIQYKFGFKFDVGETFDLLISTSPFAGIHPRINWLLQPVGAGFAFDTPINVEFVISNIDSYSVYFGAGVDYYHLFLSDGNGSYVNSFGPQLSGGVQLKFGRQLFGFRAAHTIGLTGKNKESTVHRKSAISFGIYYLLPSRGRTDLER